MNNIGLTIILFILIIIVIFIIVIIFAKVHAIYNPYKGILAYNIEMPIKDGFQMTRYIREIEA